MNALPVWLARLLAAILPALAVGLALPAAQIHAAGPAIQAIRPEPGGLEVTVRVPAGVRRLTLETRPKLGTGAWLPRQTRWHDGSAADLVFRLPGDRDAEMVRVRAEETSDLPLPASFYQGSNRFDGIVTTNNAPPSVVRGPGDLAPLPSTPNEAAGDGAAPTREVVESDIWQVKDQTVYFFNSARGFQVIDLANPDQPMLRATLPLAARGEQMYLLPPVDGDPAQWVALLTTDWCDTPRSEVHLVRVQGADVAFHAHLPVAGSVVESRLVGTALYLASTTSQVRPLAQGGSEYFTETLVTAYSLARPTAVPAPSVHRFEASPNAIMATDRFLFVATTGPSAQVPYAGGGFWYEPGTNTVSVIDISDPAGAIVPRGTLATRGRVQDKFKLHLNGEILTVVSQAGGTWVPSDPSRLNSPWTFRPSETWLETFRLAAPDRPARAGQLRIITNESLFATRFVGDRAYVVTFRQIDPLWIIDLSDPAAPAIRGELQIPGYSSYLQPLGTDRLIAMGVEQGNATVALFDVRDEARPMQLSKVFLGTGWSWSEANSDEKAFRVFPDRGLALVPWQGREGDQWVQAMQLIDVGESTLAKRGVIRHAAQARRATLLGDRLVSISANELLTVNIADRDRPVITSDLGLGFRVDRVLALGDRLLQYSASDFWSIPGSTPLLRLSSMAAPDQPLGVLALPRLSLVGWDLQGTTLQLVQHQPDNTVWETQGTNPVPVTVPGHLLASTVDCAGPVPVLRGSLRLPLPKAYWGAALAALHPQPGITVWTEDSGDSSFPPWREYLAADGPVPVATAPPRAARMAPAIIGDLALPRWGWWPWFGGNSTRTLLALEDAAGAGPRLRSLRTVTLSGDSGSFGAAFEAGGRLHFSEQVAVRELLPAPTNSVPTKDPLLPVWQPEIWKTQHRLHVVDYADPGEPTARETLPLPGALAGVAQGGSLLVTRGDTRWDTNGVPTTPVTALGYDGLSASLVATLEEPGLRLHRVEPDGHLVATRPGPAGAPARLQLWALDPDAAWRRRADAPAPENVQDVRRFGSLLVTAGGSAIAFHAAPGGAALAGVGSTARPCSLWFDWAATDLSAGPVLWIPRGEYGVTSLKPD